MKIVKEVKSSDSLGRFACGNVYGKLQFWHHFQCFLLHLFAFFKCKVHIRGPESRHKIEINKLGVEIENLTGHVHHICQYLVNIYHNFLQNTIVIVKIYIPKVKIVVLKTSTCHKASICLRALKHYMAEFHLNPYLFQVGDSHKK